MPKPIFRIFVSSTYKDLIPYRQAAEQAINELGQKFIGMEYLGALDKEPVEASLNMVEQCDLFVGIYAWRYGHIPDDSKISITAQEYHHAKKLKKPRLCYLVDEEFSWRPKFIDQGDKAEKLKQFKHLIEGERVRNTFTDEQDFKYKFVLAVSNWLLENRPELEIKEHSLDWRRLYEAFTRRQLDKIPIKHVGGGLIGQEMLELREVFFEPDAGRQSFELSGLDRKKVRGTPELKQLSQYSEMFQAHLWRFFQEHRDWTADKIKFDEKETSETFQQLSTALVESLQKESRPLDAFKFQELINHLAKKLKREPQEVLAILQGFFETNIKREPVLTQLKAPCSALLVGDAGVGKTTVMRKLALDLFDQLGSGDDNMKPIPLFVRLDKIAEYMKEDQPLDKAEQALFNYICEHWRPDLTCETDLVVPAIKSCQQPLQLILDGLDEIPSERLRRKLVAVANQLVNHTSFHIIITSRPTAVDQSLRDTLSFDEIRLLELNTDQVKKFVHNFFVIYNAHDREQGNRDALAFLSALELSEAAQEFAGNPLYLTVMILMHKKFEVLPKRRIELYAEFYEMLLLQRSSGPVQGKKAIKPVLEIPIPQGKSITWTEDVYTPLLQRIAFITHSDDQDSVSITRQRVIEAIMQQRLQSEVKGISLDDFADGFLDFADENLGVVVSRGPFFGFSHRSLQEYLAARHLSEFDDSQQIKDFWHKVALKKPDRWLEVVRLLFCTIRQKQFLFPYLEAQFPRDIADTKDERVIAMIGAILSELEEFFKDRGGIQSLHQSVAQALTSRRDRSHDQPKFFVACSDALALIDEPQVDVAGHQMVLFQPKKPFDMGSDKGQDSERPVHPVMVSPFWLSKYPVTNKEFAEFIKHGGYEDEAYWFDDPSTGEQFGEFLKDLKERLPRFWLDDQLGKRRLLAPVVGISWYEAVAYCRWWTQKYGEQWAERQGLTHQVKMRLPTEAEWEFAARIGNSEKAAGSKPRQYPWGDSPAPNLELANYDESKIEQTSAVGSYPKGATPDGIYDLVGNVWEWCYDWLDESYYQTCLTETYKTGKPVVNPTGAKTGSLRALRGGAWCDNLGILRASFRSRDVPGLRDIDVGFRCVVCELVSP